MDSHDSIGELVSSAELVSVEPARQRLSRTGSWPSRAADNLEQGSSLRPTLTCWKIDCLCPAVSASHNDILAPRSQALALKSAALASQCAESQPVATEQNDNDDLWPSN